MDFFENVLGWNLDAGSGAAEWAVVAAVVLAVASVVWRRWLRGAVRGTLGARTQAARPVVVRASRAVAGREG